MNNYNKILITSINELNLLKESIKLSEVIALDTEFTRKSTYFAKLSILQICTIDNVYIVDYIENYNLLIETMHIIYQSNVIKVFHAASNDLEIFYNIMNSLPSNIFDTQIAYMALNSSSNVSYSCLIKNLLGLKLDKSETISNWKQRPLTSKQLEYASLDVIMLYKVYFSVKEQLKIKNREDFIIEKLAEIQDISKYTFNIQKSVEQFALKNNIESNYSLLASLLKWREFTAQKRNVPRHYVLADSYIKKIITNPKNASRSFLRDNYLNNDNWKEILDESKNQLQHFNSLQPQIHLYNTHDLLGICYHLLDFISLEENICKDLICNKHTLNIMLHYFTDKNSAAKTSNNSVIDMFFVPWRHEIFTKKLDLLLKGQIYLTIKDGKILFK